jgi:hypothetical protein
MICQEIKCGDYLTNDGEPAWCYWAGQPAQVAVMKCPKATGDCKDQKQETPLLIEKPGKHS